MLHHVELNVSDLTKSKEFWGWLLPHLGYKLFQEWESGFSFLCEKTYIVFVQAEDQYLHPSFHRKRTGLNHLAFWASTKEKVDKLYREMHTRNITLLYERKYPYAGGDSHYALFCEDPDRIKVEIVAPSTK